jgi:photoactive yellow protein
MHNSDTFPASLTAPDLFDWLQSASQADMDRLSFGIVGMSPDGLIEHYNLAESRLSGLTPERILGRHFFTSVAPCTNNFMVAHRFETESEIDAMIDYVFTFRLAPTKVRLRLMKRPNARLMYLGAEQRD